MSILFQDPKVTVVRASRYVVGEFHRLHRVLSTCRVNGGFREDLSHVCNHQSCEGVQHTQRHREVMGLGLEAYHRMTCEEAGIDPQGAALMNTAANMQCAVLSEASHEDLNVRVVATAGVLGNATRAGDPAGWHETKDGSVKLQVDPPAPEASNSGTIVTLVFIDQPCSSACLVKASVMVTEGKAVALLNHRMPSLQSNGLATGTGTDQLAICAPLLGDGEFERNWAGSHNSLGELLGRATRDAVSRCLLLQNGVCAELRRSICGALGRHGCTELSLKERAQKDLSTEMATLFEKNLMAIVHDPQSAAAAYCLAESVDLGQVGTLHREVADEAMLNQAALLAASVALKPNHFSSYRDRLSSFCSESPGSLACRAVVMGFAEKWTP